MCGSPLPSPSSAFTPLWCLGRIEEFRPLRRATADRGGSDELLKKLEQNFQTDIAKRFAKSKFENVKLLLQHLLGGGKDSDLTALVGKTALEENGIGGSHGSVC